MRDEGRECVLMVGDVSGKGIAVPIEDGLPPNEICARLSRLLFSRTPPEKYATAFLAILEPASGILRFTNAGHNPALVVRASGEVEQLGPTRMPIGLMPDGVFEAGEVSIGDGDTLILYTDGITEAADPDEEEYGIERLTEVCVRHRDADLSGLAAAIANDLEDFVRGEPFPDDRTLVMARRLAD